MSRFFDALKHANKSLNSDRDNVEKDALDFSAILNGHEVGGASGEPTTAAVEQEPALHPTTSGLASAEQVMRADHGSQNGTIGLSIEAVIDPRARVIPNSVESEIVEPYRHLRTRILQQRTEKTFHTLLIASSEAKEGKTVTLLNLAYVFSMLPSFKVLVVDGDIRSGQLSRCLGISDRPGLSDLLEGSSILKDVVLTSNEIPFSFIARGNSRLSPPELLHSSRWVNHAKRLSEHFDLVLVDSPPVTLVTDAQVLASGCDAILFVARAFRTSREALEKMTRDFQRHRVIGTVLNGGQDIRGYRKYRIYDQK